MHTFSTLRDEVLRHLDEYGDTGTTKANVDNALNQAHFQRLTEERWPFMLWRVPVTFTLTSGQQLYSLHQSFHRPYYFRNTTTRQNLIEVPVRELSDVGVDWNNDTTGRHVALWGRSPVQNQPTSYSQITIVSDNAADTSSTKAITIEGETYDGIETETITPNGLSSVTGSKEFCHITAVTKAGEWVGKLTMTSDAGTVTNLTLHPTEFGRSYQQLYFTWVPGGGETIEYRFYRTPRTLSADNDIPEIPFPHSNLLVWDALMILAAYDGQIDPGRLQVWQDNQERMVVAMKQALTDGQSLDSTPRLIRFIES